jgi:hypothetical protein
VIPHIITGFVKLFGKNHHAHAEDVPQEREYFFYKHEKRKTIDYLF